MLVRVYSCQNATLLEISCRGSNVNVKDTDQPALHHSSLQSAFVICCE